MQTRDASRVDCLSDDVVFAFLDGDEDAARAVDAHIARCGDCRRTVAEAARGWGREMRSAHPTFGLDAGPTDAGAASVGPPAPLAMGTRVGRYVVDSILGVGGMGVVYAAFDAKLERRVALKVLRPGSSEHESLERAQARLLREARVMARLSHPNVVAVYDTGAFGEEVFVAMELVEGKNLRGWLRERAHDWTEILDVFIAAGRGIAAAHAAGLVHRDFKPANVLVGRDGRARVTDFGTARPSESNEAPHGAGSAVRPLIGAGASHSITRTGLYAGTPAYSAPEHLLGRAVDARSDQYSFCVALYQALYGKLPFAPAAVAELALRRGSAEPPRPARPARAPIALFRAIRRGLSTAPDARHASMDALLSELETVRMDRGRGARRRVIAWSATAIVVLGGIGLAMFYFAQPPPRAAAPRRTAEVTDLQPRRPSVEPQAPRHAPANEASAPPAPVAAPIGGATVSPAQQPPSRRLRARSKVRRSSEVEARPETEIRTETEVAPADPDPVLLAPFSAHSQAREPSTR